MRPKLPSRVPSVQQSPTTYPALGLDVGVALWLAQVAAHHPARIDTLALDLCLGHSVYGRDRLLDALASNRTSHVNMTTSTVQQLATSTTLAWTTASCIMVIDESARYLDNVFVAALSLLFFAYKDSKPKLSVFKPFVIGTAWASAIVCLPLDNAALTDLLPPTSLLYSAASSLGDIKDTEDDLKNNVTTIPALFGERVTLKVSGILAACALAAFGNVVTEHGVFWGDCANALVSTVLMIYCGVRSVG